MRYFVVAGVLLLVSTGNCSADGFYDACEGALKHRLALPETYRALGSVESSREYSGEEYLHLMEAQGRDVPGDVVKQLGAAGLRPVLFTIRLAYSVSSANDVGSTVKRDAICDFWSSSTQPDGATWQTVWIDGASAAEWDAMMNSGLAQ